VPVADALLRVLADRQVSPAVLSSGLFRHARSLCGKSGGVNFRLCSRRRFTLTRQVASTRQAAFTSFRCSQQRAAFPVPPAGSRRKSASRRRAEAALWRAAKAEGLAQSKTLREVRRPLANAPASWTVHPPQYCYGGRAVALHRFHFKARHGRTSCRAHGKVFSSSLTMTRRGRSRPGAIAVRV
jgi:hypothetical protein